MCKLLLPLIALVCISSAFRQKSSSTPLPLDRAITDTLPEKNPDVDVDVVFTRAEVEPKFAGGEMAKRKFLQKNLNVFVAYENKAPEGAYTVVLQFIVEKDGSLTELKALTEHGYGMEKEAIRAMKNSPKWESATQNGHIVRCYQKMPITFVVSKN